MQGSAGKDCTKGSREVVEKEEGPEVEKGGEGGDSGGGRMSPLGIKSAPL